jgi:lipopolysaccharide/colanic/teichoic acid biosynthesis glycosyltransferase
MVKRLLDIVAAAIGLLLLSPLFAAIAAGVKCSSPGPVFFRHERMGKNFRPFGVLKFRTMVQNASQIGGPITFGDDPRVTRFGGLLRRTKLDELPQLINVLKGDMSLVGPRPEVRRYVEMFREDYSVILQVRPGITDLASIKYRDEETVLGSGGNSDERYVRCVLPEKIRLARQYVQERSMRLDLAIIGNTFLLLAKDRVPSRRKTAAGAGAKESRQ